MGLSWSIYIIRKVGGAVDEWSKALLSGEKMNENKKILGSPPPGNFFIWKESRSGLSNTSNYKDLKQLWAI